MKKVFEESWSIIIIIIFLISSTDNKMSLYLV